MHGNELYNQTNAEIIEQTVALEWYGNIGETGIKPL